MAKVKKELVKDRLFELRDYFAGQALCGIVREIGKGKNVREIADIAYQFADAMISAKKRRRRR